MSNFPPPLVQPPRSVPVGRACRTGLLLMAVAALPTFAADSRPRSGGGPVGAPTIKGFSAPITEGNRTVARVTGAEARTTVLNGEVQISGFKLETYRYTQGGERETELVVESPYAGFGSSGAVSDRSLSLRSADDRFAITGDGWGWNRATGQLVISNNVVTTLRRPGSATNRPPVEVRSRRFEYNLRTGDARFLEQCSALEPGHARITAGLLASRLGARTERPDSILATNGVVIELLRPGRSGRAAGAAAVYAQSPEGERIEIDGNPTWSFGPGEGTADHLLLMPARDAYAARGNARLRLLRPPQGGRARPNAEPSGSTSSDPLDITAAAIEGGPREIVFTGPVHAVQGQRLDLRARRVVAKLDPDAPVTPGAETAAPKPSRVEADGEVTARVRSGSGPLDLAGERMVYLTGAEGESIEITGQPRWSSASHQGSAGRFLIRPLAPAFDADENVQVTWKTAATGSSNAPILLTSARMAITAETARFTGEVRARRDSWNVACGDLEFGLGTNAAPRSFHARAGVLLDYLMPPPPPGASNATVAAQSAGRFFETAGDEARRWRIRSDEARADLSATNAEPVALDATGKVRIEHLEVTATGGRLAYRADEGLMHLSEEARMDTRAGLVIVGRPGSTLSFDPRSPALSVRQGWQTLRLPGRTLRGNGTPVPAASR